MMLVRHEDGRIHLGVLFSEAHEKCIEAHPDGSKAGEVCFHCMTDRLKEVADLLREKELQVRDLQNVVDAARAVDAQWKRACTYDTEEIRTLRRALEKWTEKRVDPSPMAEEIKAEITCPKCKTACCVSPRDENRYWCDYCSLTFVHR